MSKSKSDSIVDRAVIKARRDALQLTMEEAAQRAGFGSKQHWNKIEGGQSRNPTVESMYRVAQVLMCHIEDLLVKPKTPRSR